SAVPALLAGVSGAGTSARARIHALWVLHRLDALTPALIEASAKDSDPLVRLHTMRILLERTPEGNAFFNLVSNALDDGDPHVKRAATELLAKYPTMEALEKALQQRNSVPENDTHQLYTTRLVLRSLLRNADLMKQVASQARHELFAKYLVDVMVGVPSEDSGIVL